MDFINKVRILTRGLNNPEEILIAVLEIAIPRNGKYVSSFRALNAEQLLKQSQSKKIF